MSSYFWAGYTLPHGRYLRAPPRCTEPPPFPVPRGSEPLAAVAAGCGKAAVCEQFFSHCSHGLSKVSQAVPSRNPALLPHTLERRHEPPWASVPALGWRVALGPPPAVPHTTGHGCEPPCSQMALVLKLNSVLRSSLCCLNTTSWASEGSGEQRILHSTCLVFRPCVQGWI